MFNIYTPLTSGRGVNSMGMSRGGQRTILLQHPQRGNDRVDSDHSDIEAVHHSSLKQKQKFDATYRGAYHQSQDTNDERLPTHQSIPRLVILLWRLLKLFIN